MFLPSVPVEPTAAVPSSAISEQGVGIRPTQTSMTQFPRQLCPYLLQTSGCFQPGRLNQGSKRKGGFFYPSLGDKWELCGDRGHRSVAASPACGPWETLQRNILVLLRQEGLLPLQR